MVSGVDSGDNSCRGVKGEMVEGGRSGGEAAGAGGLASQDEVLCPSSASSQEIPAIKKAPAKSGCRRAQGLQRSCRRSSFARDVRGRLGMCSQKCVCLDQLKNN